MSHIQNKSDLTENMLHVYACVCVCVLYFNMGEVTLHLYVDGNNPEEREIFLLQIKEGRIAGVMCQYFGR